MTSSHHPSPNHLSILLYLLRHVPTPPAGSLFYVPAKFPLQFVTCHIYFPTIIQLHPSPLCQHLKKRKRKVLEISPLIISPEVRSSSSLPYFIHFYNSSTYPHTYINFCPPDIALPTTPGCVSSVSIFLSLLFLSFRHTAHSPTSTKVKSDRH